MLYLLKYIYIYICIYLRVDTTIVHNSKYVHIHTYIYNLISAWRHVSAAHTAIFRPA